MRCFGVLLVLAGLCCFTSTEDCDKNDIGCHLKKFESELLLLALYASDRYFVLIRCTLYSIVSQSITH